jgi:hypothetical protein
MASPHEVIEIGKCSLFPFDTDTQPVPVDTATHLNLPIGNRVADFLLGLIFLDAGRRDALQCIRQPFPIWRVCHRTTAPTADRESARSRPDGGGDVSG